MLGSSTLKINIGLDGFKRSAEEEEIIDKNLASVFSTQTGKEVLRYLRSITIEMVHGPNVAHNELLHSEGQRYIVGLIERRVANAHRRKVNE